MDMKKAEVIYVQYQLFKRGKSDEELLPPNQDCLNELIRRDNFQSYSWHHAMQPTLNLPSVSKHGCKLEELTPTPDSMPEIVYSRCTKGCENIKSSCIKWSLKCLFLCHCTNSQNFAECLLENDEIELDTSIMQWFQIWLKS